VAFVLVHTAMASGLPAGPPVRLPHVQHTQYRLSRSLLHCGSASNRNLVKGKWWQLQLQRCADAQQLQQHVLLVAAAR
jgi:hypothetical protein